MNRKIAALALVAATVLLGACGSNEPSSSSNEAPIPEEPTTTWAPQDLVLVDVPVAKPAPGAPKVESTALPEELAGFTAVPGLTEAQQSCLNGAMKQALDTDPSLNKTPGKRASLSGTAITVCDGSTAFTDPVVEQMAAGDGTTPKLTPAQNACFKQAFATDKQQTAKFIAASLVMGTAPESSVEGIKQALAPFEQKCGATISDAMTANS